MKKKSWVVCLIALVCTFLLWGCKHNVAVENVFFNAPSSDGVVLLVGQTYTPEVYFSPLYPTNRGYKIISGDESVVAVRNNSLTALTQGKTYIKVVSDENQLIQDVMLVQVVNTVTKLATPSVTYSAEKQSFVISSVNQDGLINGYTLEINGENISIGNVLEYSLNDYEKHLKSSTSTAGSSAYDKDLTVRVKATVPEYTKAFEDSSFSNTIKINQASAPKDIKIVGGKLKIKKNKATEHQIFVNGVALAATDKTTFDLSVINNSFAGQNVEIQVRALGQAGEGFTAYNSQGLTKTVKCIENVDLSLINETFMWNAIDGVSTYELYKDNSAKPFAQVTNTYFDITTLPSQDYLTLFPYNATGYQVSVKTKLRDDCVNVVSSANQIAIINLNRLETPTIKCENNVVSWDSVENANSYQVKIVSGAGGVILDTTTQKTSIDFGLDKYASNANYTITVKANYAQNESGHYLSSYQAGISINKVEDVELKIENNMLKFATRVDNKYLVKITDSTNQTVYEETHLALRDSLNFNLYNLGIAYTAGKYDVSVKHLGNGQNDIDSAESNISYTYLEAVGEISVANSFVSAVAGNLNTQNNATLRFDIYKASSFIQSVENNTDLSSLNLGTGNYTIKLFVLGDKSKTLSVADVNGQEKATAVYEFTVLSVPELTARSVEAELQIGEVTHASSFNIWEQTNKTNVTNTSFKFDLASGQTCQFKVQAVGDGERYINSQYSVTKTFTRLATPELRFNNINNSILANKQTSNYKLLFNGDDITSSYVFGTSISNLIKGENHFELTAIGQINGDEITVNSLPCELVVTKIDENCLVSIDGNNLIVTPTRMYNNCNLEITIDGNGNHLVFDEANCKEKNEKLTITKTESAYTIPLLDGLYNPILPSVMAGDFTVKIRFIAVHNEENDNLASSGLSNVCAVSFAPKADFAMDTRDGQNVVFNIETLYTQTDYALIINDADILFLNEVNANLDSENKKIKVNISTIYNAISANDEPDIVGLKLVTLNQKSTDSNLFLSSLGGELKVQKAKTVELSSSKDNTLANNSRVVTFTANATSYEKKFVVKVYNDEVGIAGAHIINVSDTNSYSFNLDDYGLNLVGTKKVVVNVEVQANYVNNGKTIYVFDADPSNVMTFTIVDAPNYSTDGAKLIFDLPNNVAGVDVYKSTSTGFEKLNTNIITNEFNLAGYAGEMTLMLKGIARDTGDFTNSQLSEPIYITKLSTPAVSVEKGMIVLTLGDSAFDLFTTASTFTSVEDLNGCVIRFAVDDGEVKYIHKDTNGIEIETNRIIIDPTIVLNYGTNGLVKENVKFECIAKVETGTLYLDSNIAQVDFYGLFAPTKISLPSSNDEIKLLTWQDNNKNKINSTDVFSGYTFKIVDEQGLEYYSTTDLVYLQNGNETNYPSIIQANSIPFPYGFKDTSNNDRVVPFVTGKYKVYVRTIPKENVTGFNLCCSAYSEFCEVTMLEKPVLTVAEGVITWRKIDSATNYSLTLTDLNDETKTKTIVLVENYFEFEGSDFDAYVGNYKVEVKALSGVANVVDSEMSGSINVHRLPTYKSLLVDDGVLILKANGYFTIAKLSFKNVSTGVEENFEFACPNYETNLENLTSADWVGTNLADLNAEFNYAIKIDDDYLIKLSAGVYEVSVKLMGNSRQDNTKLIVNSALKKETDVERFIKLSFDEENEQATDKTWLRVDERGVFTFDAPASYQEGRLNYQFNTPVENVDYSFFKNAIIYKITVKVNNDEHSLFAIDYDNFIANESKLGEGLFEKLSIGSLYGYVKYPYIDNGETKYVYFSVYTQNQINLNLDNFYYYKTTMNVVDNSPCLATVLNETPKGYFTVSLIEGGVFIIETQLLGCDITTTGQAGNETNLAYLSSNLVASKSFIRYTDNILMSYIQYTADNANNIDFANFGGLDIQANGGGMIYTYSGQVIFQNKIKRDEGNNPIDYPVYELEITPNVYYSGKTVGTSEVYIYYLYHDENSVDEVIEMNKRTATNTQKVKVLTLENNFEYLRFDMSKYFEAGNYAIKIRTLAGVGTADLDSKYLLNSRVPISSYLFKRISDTELKLNSGKIQFELAYVMEDTIKSYINSYEFTVIDGADEYTFKIDSVTDGVSVKNNVLTYALPSTVQANKTNLNAVDTVELNLTNGKEYGFKVRALQPTGNTGILNAGYAQQEGEDIVTNLTKSQGIGMVKIKDGKILWQVKDKANYTGTVIRIEFGEGDVRVIEETITQSYTKTITIDGQEYFYYEISDGKYECLNNYGQSEIPAGKYTLKLYTIGDSNSILNSDYCEDVEMNRLKMVNANSIKSLAGVLTWEHMETEHVVKYVVSLSGTENYTFTTTQTSIDFGTILDDNNKALAVGKYSVTIKAEGDDYISSMPSTRVDNFTKLGSVSALTEQGNGVKWDAVDNAQGYQLTFEWTKDGEPQTETKVETGCECTFPETMTGAYKITIRAVGVGEGKVFNGEIFEFTGSNEMPETVENITFNQTDLNFYIKVGADFKTNDKVRVSYNIQAYTYDTNGTQLSQEEGKIDYATSTKVIDGETYFVYPLEAVGLYTQISVCVERGKIVSYPKTFENIDFNYFASGDGSETNQYIIANAGHLLNISYRPDKHFKLYQSINMSDVDFASRINTYNAIISNTFAGSLDGAGTNPGEIYSIYGLSNVSISNIATDYSGFALFNEIDGATIKNINIAETDNEMPTKFVNTFANKQTNMLKLAIVAKTSTNSTLNNVNVPNAQIGLTGSGKIQAISYIGGLIATATNTSIIDCSINLVVDLQADFVPASGASIYIGGVVASATNTTISAENAVETKINSTLKITQPANTTRRIYAVGGVVAYIEGANSQITGMTVKIEQDATIRVGRFGGVAGEAIATKIYNCTLTGNVMATLDSDSYLAGVAGLVQGGEISNSIIKLDFTLSLETDININVGYIAGFVTVYNAKITSIDSCGIMLAFGEGQLNQGKTVLGNGKVENMGIYGVSNQTNYNPTNCYEIK